MNTAELMRYTQVCEKDTPYEMLYRAAKQKPDKNGVRRTRFLVVVDTQHKLRYSMLSYFFRQLEEAGIGTWRKQKTSFFVSFDDVETELITIVLATDSDVTRLYGMEVTGAYLHIEERWTLPEDIVSSLMARVGRYPRHVDGGATWYGIIGRENCSYGEEA